MKSLKCAVLTFILAMASAQAKAQIKLLCEAGVMGTSDRDVLTETKIGERARYELQIVGYSIEVLELISKDQNNPTLSLKVKDSDGIIMTTMLPAPGVGSGNAFVRTELKIPTGYMFVKCITRKQ